MNWLKSILVVLSTPYAESILGPLPPSLISDAPKVDTSSNFPTTDIVMDMIMLSDAVYHLLNKVDSCVDSRANDQTMIDSTRNEMFHIRSKRTSHSDHNGWDAPKERHVPQFLRTKQTPENLFDIILPDGITCLHYSHDHTLGTQVLVARSSRRNYVAVVYAGTDDWNTALMDGDILMGDFGPGVNGTKNGDSSTSVGKSGVNGLVDKVPEGVRVHRGFNSAVFDDEAFSKILQCVESARLGGNCYDSRGSMNLENTSTQLSESKSNPYQIYTSGHSLGAADSVLLGAALHMTFPTERIQSINFGCPKIGNVEWSSWIDSMQTGLDGNTDSSHPSGSFDIYRFVNKMDLVPRLPELLFQHAGHTLQMSIGGEIRAYYNHFGNEEMGYASVPFGWGAEPYVFLPGGILSHNHKNYFEYLDYYQPKANSSQNQGERLYYVKDFERVDQDGMRKPPDPPVNYFI